MQSVHCLSLCLIVLLSLVVLVTSQGDPECLCLEEVEAVRDFRNPLVIKHSRDGTDRLFVAEQVGVVWVLTRNDDITGGWERLAEPFMNITVYFEDRPADEQGFLALEFHPEYANNGLFYTWYSYSENEARFTRLSEFRVDPDNANVADPTYERVILQVEQVFWNHNGGDLHFMPDGTMLIFTGDGGIAGDPLELGQNLTTFLGKTLRIDVDGRDEGLEYAVPQDNPYLDVEGALPELYAIGLRNPWRVFYDPQSASGVEDRYFIGDVGQNAVEEIDILRTGGVNFGWSVYEGRQCYKPEQCAQLPINETIPPINEYYHETGDGRCIIQGPMYRGCENPDLNGWLFFSDWDNGNMYRLLDQLDATEWTGRTLVPMCSAEVCQAPLTNVYVPSFLTWGVDERNEVYFGSTDGIIPVDSPQGRVYKIVDPSNRGDPCDLPQRKKKLPSAH